MREILFRGKRTDNGEWVYGGYWENQTTRSTVHVIDKSGNSIEIISETVGRYTGLTDKNGVKIFEGDIVTGTAYSFERVGVIVWIEEIAGFGVKYRKRGDAAAWENASILRHINRGRNDQFTAEVIGNVYDTPELLKGEEK